VNSKSVAPSVVCLLLFAVLSQRFLAVRQWAIGPGHTNAIQSPLNVPFESKAEFFLPPATYEDVSDLQQFARAVIVNKTEPIGLLPDSPVLPSARAHLLSIYPADILQPVLNL
jgi:hypothetical protein